MKIKQGFFLNPDTPFGITINLVLYSCRIFIGYLVQDIDDLVHPMNGHLTKDESEEILSQCNNLQTMTEKDTKPYILKHLENIKLFRSHYIATSTINYGSYMDNMFAVENLTHISIDSKVIDSKLYTEINRHSYA